MLKPWMNDRVISDRSFRIVDLAVDEDVIVGKTFEDCTIYGPAVIAPIGITGFEHNSFEADPEALFWEIPSHRMRVVGAIGLQDCMFRRCVFRRIGVAGPRELLDRFLDSGRG